MGDFPAWVVQGRERQSGADARPGAPHRSCSRTRDRRSAVWAGRDRSPDGQATRRRRLGARGLLRRARRARSEIAESLAQGYEQRPRFAPCTESTHARHSESASQPHPFATLIASWGCATSCRCARHRALKRPGWRATPSTRYRSRHADYLTRSRVGEACMRSVRSAPVRVREWRRAT